MKHVSTFFVCLFALAVSTAACSGGETFVGEEDDDGSAPSAAAQQEFLVRCKAATDAACQKGFDCDSFFVTSKFNSAAHCQSNVDQDYEASVDDFTSNQLLDCAEVCDVMLADVNSLTCENFDMAIFNRYRCGG